MSHLASSSRRFTSVSLRTTFARSRIWKQQKQYLELKLCWPMTSVTRFVEIQPLWQIFKNTWQFIWFWAKFSSHTGRIWAKFHCCKWPNIENTIWGHLVTLLMTLPGKLNTTYLILDQISVMQNHPFPVFGETLRAITIVTKDVAS